MFNSGRRFANKVSNTFEKPCLHKSAVRQLAITPQPLQVAASSPTARRCSRLIVKAEQKGKGVGRGGYPVDEDKAKQLRHVAEKMDAFFASTDGAAFDAVASPNITVHADLLILDNDLSGAEKVKSTLQTYTSAFEYKHENIAHGADIDGSSVFHFWLHQVTAWCCSIALYAGLCVTMWQLQKCWHASVVASLSEP